MTKVCNACRVEKPLEAFYRIRKGEEERRQGRCKQCDNATRTENLRCGPRLDMLIDDVPSKARIDKSYWLPTSHPPEPKPDPAREANLRDTFGQSERSWDAFWSRAIDCCVNALSGDGPHGDGSPRPNLRAQHQSPFVGRSPRLMSHGQYRLLGFIRGTIAALGRPPTWRAMRAHMGWTNDGAVSQCLASLERKGAIRRPGRGRIEVVG